MRVRAFPRANRHAAIIAECVVNPRLKPRLKPGTQAQSDAATGKAVARERTDKNRKAAIKAPSSKIFLPFDLPLIDTVDTRCGFRYSGAFETSSASVAFAFAFATAIIQLLIDA